MSDLDQKGLEAASMAAMWGHDLSKEERAERIVRAYLASAAPEKDEPVGYVHERYIHAMKKGAHTSPECRLYSDPAKGYVPLYLRPSRSEEAANVVRRVWNRNAPAFHQRNPLAEKIVAEILDALATGEGK